MGSFNSSKGHLRCSFTGFGTTETVLQTYPGTLAVGPGWSECDLRVSSHAK